MDKVYVKFKPCYKTLYKGYDEEPFLPDLWFGYEAVFTNGKCSIQNLYITSKLKYVYFYYDGYVSYFRVTAVSTKPFSKTETNKVEEWHKLTKKINTLKAARKELLNNKGE
ncbi:MAG: hypothetical protein J6S14_15295 [Clostridia bacterium]|nr:hypothetical protein [Clostridia bacterium]